MIKISITENKEAKAFTLKVEGHAGQAEAGKDIICASASMLSFTVAQYAKFMFDRHQLKKKPTIHLEDGNAEVTIKPKTEFYAEAMHTYFVAQVGFSLLAHNYPQYVEFTGFKEV